MSKVFAKKMEITCISVICGLFVILVFFFSFCFSILFILVGTFGSGTSRFSFLIHLLSHRDKLIMFFFGKNKERHILRIARTKDEESTTHPNTQISTVVHGHVGIP